MTSIDADTLESAIELLETYLGDTIEGLVANAKAMEADPRDKDAGRRVRSHLIDLERMLVVHEGLRLL